MLTKQQQSRYQKQTILPEIGLAGQEKLCIAKVLVIGAGGLGCPVLQYLAAAGIDTLGIADGDVVELSNLQRQVLYSAQDLGLMKVSVAAGKLQAMNPDVTIKTYPFFINSNNITDVMREYDIIVDGSDNFATRYLVNDACILLGKPMVSGAIYKFEGQVSVFNYKNGPTYRCIFPEPPGEGESPNCADIGVVASLPGIIGSIQANEVIKIITGAGEPLSGKLLVIDTLTMNSRIFHFKRNEANSKPRPLADEQQQCKVEVNGISYADLLSRIGESPIQLVDVRETEEHEMGNIGGINLPLSIFSSKTGDLDREKTTILYCASGKRSRKAAEILVAKGFREVFSLENGIHHLALF